jgi:hypothetical protein
MLRSRKLLEIQNLNCTAKNPVLQSNIVIHIDVILGVYQSWNMVCNIHFFLGFWKCGLEEVLCALVRGENFNADLNRWGNWFWVDSKR